MARTVELAPPNEGGDNRLAEVAVVREAELTVAAAGLLLTKETVSDSEIEQFLDSETAAQPASTDPGETPSEPATVRGSTALFVEGSERYGYQGSPVLGRVMRGGIRNRASGIEGRAFLPPNYQPKIGRRAIQGYLYGVIVS